MNKKVSKNIGEQKHTSVFVAYKVYLGKMVQPFKMVNLGQWSSTA